MISTFHLRAFTAAFILSLFAALIPQGFASGTKTDCETCVATPTNAWCIKDYGTEKARNCVAKDVTGFCLGGTTPAVCPVAPVPYDAPVPDVTTCDACQKGGGKWCIKNVRGVQTKGCFTDTTPGTLCMGDEEAAYDTCPVAVASPNNDRAETTATGATCAACSPSATGAGRWCVKDYGHGTIARYCVAESNAGTANCLGGVVRATGCDAEAADNAAAADLDTCVKCRNAGHKWCIKSGSATRTCLTAANAKTLCINDGDNFKNICEAAELDASAVTGRPTTTRCPACTAVKENSWCIKGYGTPKPNYCIVDASKATDCMGGMAVRDCMPTDDRALAADKKTCADCETIKQNWCITGAGAAQVRACVPKSDTTACKTADIKVCSTIKGNDLQATLTVKTTKPPTTNTTKPNRASTLGVSAVPFFTVLGALTVLG